MTEFEELIEDVRAWHVRVFGNPCDPKRTAIKLLEETAELHAALRGDAHSAKINESVDVALVLFNIIGALMSDDDDSPGDFLDGVRVRMEEVERRDQRKRDTERGIVPVIKDSLRAASACTPASRRAIVKLERGGRE